MVKRVAFVSGGRITNVALHPDDYAPVAGEVDVTGLAFGPGDLFDGTTFSAGPHPERTQAANRAVLTQQVTDALVRLRQIEAQTAAFQAPPVGSQSDYTAGNLASLNDLLHKAQALASAVNDLAAIELALIRVATNAFDEAS